MDIVERPRLTDLQLAQEAADEIERLLAHAVKMRLVCEELAERLGDVDPMITFGEDAVIASPASTFRGQGHTQSNVAWSEPGQGCYIL
jgi:hypothetical protein